MVDAVLFSSEVENWETPQELFDWLNSIYKFDLDAAAAKGHSRCKRFLGRGSSLGNDCLTLDWPTKSSFFNPPYSREVIKFIKKAYEQGQRDGVTVVCLLPSRTDTQWFHRFGWKADELIFIEGRLHFRGASNTAPFPSVIVIFKKTTRKYPKVSRIKASDIMRDYGAPKKPTKKKSQCQPRRK